MADSNNDIKLGFRYVRRYKKLLVINISLLLLGSLTEGVGIGMIIPILQTVSGTESDNIFSNAFRSVFERMGIEFTFVNLMIVFCLLMLFKYGLIAGQRYAARVLSASVTCRLREEAFENLMALPLGYFYRQRTGDIIATLYTSSNHAGGLIENVALMFVGIVFCAVYLVVNLMLSVPMTVVAFSLTAMLYFLILPRFRIGLIQGREEKEITDAISSFIMEKISGIKTLKSFHNEEIHQRQFEKLARSFRKLQIKIQNNRILAELSLEPVITVLIVILLIVGVNVYHMSIPVLITFFYAFSRILPKLKQVNSNYISIKNYLPHFSKIYALIDRTDKTYLPKGTKKVPQIIRGITLDHVWFRYPGSDNYALKEISLLIERSETTAFVGASGGGKTTLVDLIMRHHDPAKGFIFVDDIDLREVDRREWLAGICIVNQDPYLFNDTVYNNILYGKVGATGKEVNRAADLANARQFIELLPDGYDTLVGERGTMLSGGQKQRIALARALIKDPEILILDEATSSLDTESEKLIQSAIKKLSGSKTIIVIAHRLSTIMHAEKVVVIENGRIVEQGNPNTLLDVGNIFKKYYSLQFGRELIRSVD